MKRRLFSPQASFTADITQLSPRASKPKHPHRSEARLYSQSDAKDTALKPYRVVWRLAAGGVSPHLHNRTHCVASGCAVCRQGDVTGCCNVTLTAAAKRFGMYAPEVLISVVVVAGTSSFFRCWHYGTNFPSNNEMKTRKTNGRKKAVWDLMWKIVKDWRGRGEELLI